MPQPTTDNPAQPTATIGALFQSRRRLLVLTFWVTVAVLAVLTLHGSTDRQEGYDTVIPLPLPAEISMQSPAAGRAPKGSDTLTGPDELWARVRVKPGQTLDAIFRQRGYSASLLHDIVHLDRNTAGLKSIRPGDTFEFLNDAGGDLLQMRYALDERNYLLVTHFGDELNAEVQPREIITEVSEAQGVIRSSLFSSAKRAGLSDAMTMKLANIFGWDIDFVLEVRDGDRFAVIYQKLYRDGVFLRDGEILAATFINQGQRYQAVRFEVDGRSEYFSPDGSPMRKAFLRAPLNFSYISSGFNPRRMHPILKRLRPHNGTDYAAPRGTPVYAAGDGVVIRSSYSKANGNHVFIRHANGIETRYLHFSRRAVKRGDHVKQGQVIGYVGSTGLATGPHLHYEFLVHGVHRNPRTVNLPTVASLKGKALADFRKQAGPMLTQLARLESASMYATAQ